jgi:hypothetical protein
MEKILVLTNKDIALNFPALQNNLEIHNLEISLYPNLDINRVSGNNFIEIVL